MAIKISGSTIIDDSRNIVNAGVITATDAVITGDLTVQGTTTTIDTNLIGVDRIEVGANSSSFPAIAVTQSGSANLAHFYNSSGNTALVLTNSNRLGIGTDSPKTQLEVLGEFSISNASEPGYGSSIRTYEPASNPDIVNLVPGSTFGTLFESTKNGHLVFGIRDNDTIDSVSIVSGSGNYAADSTYDKAIARFQADGKVGIGTNNPDASLEIAASFPTIRLKDADTNAYSDIDGNGANLILKADRSGTVSNSSIQFNIDVSEVARFTSDQYLRFASGSSGIQFDGATAADDALDAYEEGSWNPDVRSSTTSIKTYTNAGYYVRIGNLVHCGLEILDNSFSTALTGEIRIYGLPFTPSNGRVNTMSPISYNGAFGNADFIGQLDMSSSTYVRIYTDPGAAGALTVNLIPTVYRIYAQFTYTIA